MSAASSFTFRCYRCNKLLGVSRSKAGSVVMCPKCRAELLVPVPPEPEAPPQAPAADDVSGLPTERTAAAPSLAPATPASFLGIKLEPDPPAAAAPAPFFPAIQTEPVSLRPDPPSRRAKPVPKTQVEPVPPLHAPSPAVAMELSPFVIATTSDSAPAPPVIFPQIDIEPPSLRPDSGSRRARPPSASGVAAAAESPLAFLNAPEPGPAESVAPAQGLQATAARTEPPARPIARPDRAPTPAPAAGPSPPSPFVPVRQAETSPPAPAASVVFTAIQAASEPLRTEPPSLLADRASGLRRNDVALPRTTVVLWSFFVILALAMAFAAGLLAGHFVWKVH